MRNSSRAMMIMMMSLGSAVMATFLPWVMIATMPLFTIFGAGPVAIYAMILNLHETIKRRGIKTVVVVDDDAVTLSLVKRAFESMGYRTHAFDSPMEALMAMKNLEFDYALVDQIMPELSGADFVVQLDNQLADTHSRSRPEVLMFTGHPEGVHINGRELHNMHYRGILSKKEARLGSLRRMFSQGLGMEAS